jgi:hypothetical protein
MRWDAWGGRTVAQFEADHPQSARRNVDAAPRFVDAAAGDFRLRADSPLVDAGVPLTRATAAGRGRTLDVRDALFFCNGFGLVEPDVLSVGGARAVVEDVDYERGRITLDREIAWDADAAVSLAFEGGGPDIGAFESAGSVDERAGGTR